MSAFCLFRLAIIQLGANVVQPGGVDAVRLPVHGSDQLFGAEFFEDVQRAVAQYQPFTGIAHLRVWARFYA